VDAKILEELKFLQKCNEVLSTLGKDAETINAEYKEFYDEFEKIFNDVESIKQTLLKEVLTAGKGALSSKYYTQESCPLCLKTEKRDSLLASIEDRLKEIAESSEKLKGLERAKVALKLTVEERIGRLDALLRDSHFKMEGYITLKSTAEALKNKLSGHLTETRTLVLNGKMPRDYADLEISTPDFLCTPTIEVQLVELTNRIPKDTNSDVLIKIEFAKAAFAKISDLNLAKKTLETQKDSLEIIFNEFVKKQKEGLETFLTSFSAEINEYFQFMNPGAL
jgi:hypothetical protein